MRKLSITQKAQDWQILRLFLVATAFAVAMMIYTVQSSFAGGAPCITYRGEPVCAESTQVAATSFFQSFVMDVREMHATSPLTNTQVFSGSDELNPMNFQRCMGDSERHGNEFVLTATKYMTERDAEGRYIAVTPPAGKHGDWPPHGILQSFRSNRAVNCSELESVISFKYHIQPVTALNLAYSFRLNPQHLDEYSVLASGGELALFLSSPVTTTIVNGEALYGAACNDCGNHTNVITTTTNAIYTADELTFTGDYTSAGALDEVYILPISKDPSVIYNIMMEIPAGGEVWMWLGQANFPKR